MSRLDPKPVPSAAERARALFVERYGEGPEDVVVSPGRVNIIGDHTDYSEGFVLPIAIDRYTAVAYRSRGDDNLDVLSELAGEVHRRLADQSPTDGWDIYVQGVAWALGVERGSGWDGVISTDIPVGAGLSSSAALEVAAAYIFARLEGRDIDERGLALAAQRAENEFVGVACGIMDQLTVAAGSSGHSLLIDCRNLDWTTHPLPSGTRLIVLDSRTRRTLSGSSYGVLRDNTGVAARSLGVDALRDLAVEDLPRVESKLDESLYRQVKHVVTENERTLAAAEAMDADDAERLGRLMRESHSSMSEDLRTSIPEIDHLVETAVDAPGCFGARMTGGGFGGCVVALVESGEIDRFAAHLAASLAQVEEMTPRLFLCNPAPGVHSISDGARAE